MNNKILLAFVLAGLLIGGSNLVFAADADCVSAGGNCNSTASGCSNSGGSIITSVQCTNTSYVCCRPNAQECPGECVPADPPSCSTTNNHIVTGYNCGEGGVCCVANSTTGSTVTITFTNPLKYDTVEEVLTSLLNALQGVIVVISIVFIVIGAIFYITSGGSEERIKTAKKAIFASLIGLAIGIAAPTFLKEIYTILGAGEIPSEVSSAPTIATIALNTLNFLLSIVGTISLIMLIVAAIMYLTAAGDEDRIDKGKKLFKYALIGITIALASLVVVKQIAGFFGG